MPPEANRQVTREPSVDNLARVQSPQKGFDTDAMTPISPLPSRYADRVATSPA